MRIRPRPMVPAAMVAVSAFLMFAGPAGADPALHFEGSGTSGGHDFGASADFSVVGSNLVLVLTNTSGQSFSAGDKASDADVLTAVFFDVTGSPTLSDYVAATPTAGSGLIQPLSLPAPTDLRLATTAGGWDYDGSISTGVGQRYGFGTAGLGIFAGGTSNTPNGRPYAYGLIGSGYATGLGNNAKFNAAPLVQNSITFTLGDLPTGFALTSTSISNVRFQYTTALDGFHLTDTIGESPDPPLSPAAVPEPSTLVLALCGAVPLGMIVRRRRSRRPAAG